MKARAAYFSLFEKIAKLIIYFVSGVVIARFSTPDAFGSYSAIVSCCVIFSVFSALGTNGLLVKKFCDEANSGFIFINSILLRIFSGLFSGFLCFLFVRFYLGQPTGVAVAAGLIVPLSVFQVIDAFLESRLQLQKIFYYKVFSYLCGFLLKIWVALKYPTIFGFVLAHLLELTFLMLGSFFTFCRGSFFSFLSKEISFNFQANLVARSLPLLVSGGAVIVYMKIDLPMIVALHGPAEAGIYAVASRLVDAALILSAPIIVSRFPDMVKNYDSNFQKFEIQVRKLKKVLFLLGLFVLFAMLFTGDFWLRLFFGDRYAGSFGILCIYALSVPIVYVGDLFSRWLVITDRLRISVYRHLFGLCVNVLCNFLLVPSFGGTGAAIASVFGFFTAAILVPVLHPASRVFYFGSGRTRDND